MRLIPAPKKVQLTGGKLCASDFIAELGSFDTVQTRKALADLKKDAKERIKDAGAAVLIAEKAEEMADCEEYSLIITEEKIVIKAGSARGVFYAIQTLRQIVISEEAFLCCEIYDKPDFSFRGLQNDTTRGRVPSLSGLKKTADFCALFKINKMALYFEHSLAFSELEGVVTETETLSPDELREFVSYCSTLYIDVIPYVAMFGHQYRLLQSDKYKHLCELENHVPVDHYWRERMLHHSIDVSNPESFKLIKSYIDQLLEIFPYEIYIPGIDETMDLCKGKNKDINMIETYCAFTDRICGYLKEKGKTALIADDVIQKHEDGFLIKSDNIIMYHWDYEKEPKESKFEKLKEKELPFISVPSTNSYNIFFEKIGMSKENIYNTINLAKKHKAKGIINTIWGDFGHWCDFNCTLYGIVMGAAKSWNTQTEFDESFEKDFSLLVYEEKEENIKKIIATGSTLTYNSSIYWFVRWYGENLVRNENTDFCLIEPETSPLEFARRAVEHKELIQKIGARHPRKKEIFDSMAVSCGMIEALCHISNALTTKKKLTDTERALIEERMNEYHKVWLRDNKEGEFYINRAFVNDIIEYTECNF